MVQQIALHTQHCAAVNNKRDGVNQIGTQFIGTSSFDMARSQKPRRKHPVHLKFVYCRQPDRTIESFKLK